MDRSDDVLATIVGLRRDVAALQAVGASRWGSPSPAGPLGQVAFVKNAGASQTLIGAAATDLTGLSVTWTRDVTRRYRYLFTVVVQQVTSGGTLNIILTEGAGAGATLTQPGGTLLASAFGTVTCFYEGSGASGSVVHHLRGATSAGTLSILNSASNPSFLSIDDIGPA